MSRVFVLHDNPYSPKDFSPAEEFGEIVIVFHSHIAAHHLPRCAGQIRDKMRGANKDDWFIATGPPALIAMAGHIWYEMTGGFKMLAWDNHSYKYLPVEIGKI